MSQGTKCDTGGLDTYSKTISLPGRHSEEGDSEREELKEVEIGLEGPTLKVLGWRPR